MASLKKLSHGPLGIQPDWQLIVIQPEETEDIWSVQMSACQRRQGCSTSPFGQRTFATRPPSKAEDMGLSQGSFVSFLEERVKEVFTSIHVSVESTKPAEVYTTRP